VWKFSTVLAVHFLSIKKRKNGKRTTSQLILKLKYDRERRTRTFRNSWIDKFPWVVFDENAQEMYCKYCRKFPHLSDRKDALTLGTKNLCIDGLKLHDKHQEHLLCVKHWFKELDDPQVAAGPSQAFAAETEKIAIHVLALILYMWLQRKLILIQQSCPLPFPLLE
jgi:hypothetical protein